MINLVLTDSADTANLTNTYICKFIKQIQNIQKLTSEVWANKANWQLISCTTIFHKTILTIVQTTNGDNYFRFLW